MSEFLTNRPLTTDQPKIEVTVSPNAPLVPGVHRFELIVTDDAGNESEPAEVEVVITDNEKPTAVIDAPRTVPAGMSFTLSGARSTDPPPGKIVRYRWTRLT
ncbi:MAG: hypothetical protein ABI589_11620 [Burkholderiales bacterium]